jgi:NAD(P)-dependent dehydrogenase (short-subunit alcohol dehydrogenase family)
MGFMQSGIRLQTGKDGVWGSAGQGQNSNHEEAIMKIELKGRTAVVTGGSRGLGEAMAKSLAGAGAQIALVARDRARLELVQGDITAQHGVAEVFVADVTQEKEVGKLAEAVKERLGSPQILINSAGTNLRKNLVDFALEEFRSVLDASLISTFLTCRAFVPGMRGTGYGRILNMSSIMSHVSLAGRSAYSSAKAALLGLTRALALELASEGITVNGISPGPIGTDMNRTLMNNPEVNAQFLANLPVGRWGNVEEVGALACYLCSEAAGFITGTDILIDGGWTAR